MFFYYNQKDKHQLNNQKVKILLIKLNHIILNFMLYSRRIMKIKNDKLKIINDLFQKKML